MSKVVWCYDDASSSAKSGQRLRKAVHALEEGNRSFSLIGALNISAIHHTNVRTTYKSVTLVWLTFSHRFINDGRSRTRKKHIKTETGKNCENELQGWYYSAYHNKLFKHFLAFFYFFIIITYFKRDRSILLIKKLKKQTW